MSTQKRLQALETFFASLHDAQKGSPQMDAQIAIAAGLIKPMLKLGFPEGTVFTDGRRELHLSPLWAYSWAGWPANAIRPYSILFDAAYSLMPPGRILSLRQLASGRWWAGAEAQERKWGERIRLAAATEERGAAGVALAVSIVALRARIEDAR